MANARICAFGSTHHPRTSPEKDQNLKFMLESGAPVFTLFARHGICTPSKRCALSWNAIWKSFTTPWPFSKENAASCSSTPSTFRRLQGESGIRHSRLKKAMKPVPTYWSSATPMAVHCPMRSAISCSVCARNCLRQTSASMRTTTATWLWPIQWRPYAKARPRFKAPSTARRTMRQRKSLLRHPPVAAQMWGRLQVHASETCKC